MEGFPPGGTMEDRHEMMLEEKVCASSQNALTLPEKAIIIMFHHTERYLSARQLILRFVF